GFDTAGTYGLAQMPADESKEHAEVLVSRRNRQYCMKLQVRLYPLGPPARTPFHFELSGVEFLKLGSIVMKGRQARCFDLQRHPQLEQASEMLGIRERVSAKLNQPALVGVDDKGAHALARLDQSF